MIISLLKNLLSKWSILLKTRQSKFVYNVLLMIVFTFVYKFISDNDEKAFSQKLDYTNAFYYSSITHFTIGYGDILPVSPLAKMLVVVHTFMFWIAWFE